MSLSLAARPHPRLATAVLTSTPRLPLPFHLSHRFRSTVADFEPIQPVPPPPETGSTLPRAEHAVISAFDLFSIGVGPSSSHTVGPMRAGKIFVTDLEELGILDKVRKLKIGLYGSLAATGKGHMTPEAVMMGLEGGDPETIETSTIASRYSTILSTNRLTLNGTHTITYSHQKDMLWDFQPLPAHPNGMRFSVYDEEGTLLAVNEYYSVGGGFVVNERTQVDENAFYKSISKTDVSPGRLDQTHGASSPSSGAFDGLPSPLPPFDGAEQVVAPSSTSSFGVVPGGERARPAAPPFLFRDAAQLLKMTQKHNLTIAQLVWENERHQRTDAEIHDELLKLWRVMDASIHAGVSSTEEILPGRLQVRRRAPTLYKRLFKGFYPSLQPSHSPSLSSPSSPSLPFPSTAASPSPSSPSPFPSLSPHSSAPLVTGSFGHPLPPSPRLKATFPGVDFLSLYAIAVNETNASGGRVVTAPTNGAAGVIPAVLKYLVEFISSSPSHDIQTFLLTASAIGMLIKRGSTISAAEGGCMAEVGVASSMAAAGYTACLGGTPSQILQAAEIGLEHSLGLTCDPIDGLVQVPCIERNSLGASKSVTAAQLALANEDNLHAGSVSLDEAIEAMRLTAEHMHSHFKETSLSGLATTVKIPLSSPAC
ncbi:hypothetical protein JCM8547_003142 [Rhodosporidiobolus lusitaniae]